MERNNKGLMVLVIILSLLVVGLGGYIIYDKFINVEEDNNKVVDNDNINFDLARGYINNIIDLGAYNLFNRLFEEGLTDDVKLSMALSGSDNFKQSYTCGEAFTSNFAGGVEYRPVGHGLWACGINNDVYSVNYNNVNLIYNNLFGNKGDAPKKIEYCDTNMCDYSKNTNSYVVLDIQATGLSPSKYYYEVNDVKINNNELKINISYLYYYQIINGNYNYSINNIDHETDNEDDIKKVYIDNEKLLPSLTFVFEKQNQDYILKSVE